MNWPELILAGGVVVLMIAGALTFTRERKAIESVGVSLLSILYVGLLLSFVLRTRLDFITPSANHGTMALVLLLAVVKGNDIGAYCTGKLIGRHRIAPTLSPGKTIEGTLGGLALGVGAALLVCGLWTIDGYRLLTWPWALVYGLVVGLAGQVGDLVESVIKRDSGRKDSGRTLGPFGGAMDMADSVLLAAPVAYVLVAVAGVPW